MTEQDTQKPVLLMDNKEHVIEDMTDDQKQMINHINDVQNKINTNAFAREQLEVAKEAFVSLLRKSLEDKDEIKK